MAGLLDFLQTPQGIGLLSGVASYAANARRGTPVNNVGRGLAGGFLGFQEASNTQKLEREKSDKIAALKSAFNAGITPATAPMQAQYSIGGYKGNAGDIGMIANQNADINSLMRQPPAKPFVGNPSTETFALKDSVSGYGTPISAIGEYTVKPPTYESTLTDKLNRRAMGEKADIGPPYFSPKSDKDFPGIQQEQVPEELPEQAMLSRQAQEGKSESFDPRKAAMAMLQSGDPELMNTGFKLLSEIPKGQEFGTTPFVDAEGNAYLIGKDGTILPAGIKGQQKEGTIPYGQDMRELLAVKGIDYKTATPEQLQWAYESVNQQKDRRSPKTTVTVGGTTVINDAAREKLGGKLGTDVGEQAASIEGKWSALDSVREAKDMLGKGIYSGSWSNIKMALSKGTKGAIGDRKKAANTEAYVSYIGNTVIPRLKEFGGNDSNEELNYLKGVMGGNIEMEPEALARILDSVEVKIQRGIERLQRQQQTIESGGVPDLGGGPGRQPTRVRRYNPATGRIE